MRLRVLGSGSRGNSALLSADETLILLDAGLPIRDLSGRLEAARIGHRGIDHVLVTHGHLDHSRSAGIIAKRHRATLYCADRYFQNRPRARRRSVAPDRGLLELEARRVGSGSDCSHHPRPPRLRSHGRSRHRAPRPPPEPGLGHGEPRGRGEHAGEPHVLMLEANTTSTTPRRSVSPSPPGPRRRPPATCPTIRWPSCSRAWSPWTHTVILIHLSEKNNTPTWRSTRRQLP